MPDAPSPQLDPEIRFPHIYVHLPFCQVICHYCDFYVARNREADYPRLFSALVMDKSRFDAHFPNELSTIYFGGGTPSEAPPEMLANFLGSFGDRISKNTEIVIESNPTSIDAAKAKAWRAAGVTRVSIGVQSLDDKRLQKLSRVHSAAEALSAVETIAREIPNVSADLIYGVPGMSDADAAEDAAKLARAGAKHVSAYTLTLKPSHFMHAKLPDDETTLRQSEAVRDELARHGILSYEASNYAIPGFESRHNQAYWSSKPYAAFGPSAHGYDGAALRWKNVADWRAYCDAVEKNDSPLESLEILSAENQRTEFFLTRLRTVKGLDLHEYEARFGEPIPPQKMPIFDGLAKAGLGDWEGRRWKPTFAGLMLADEVALRLA